MPFRKSFPAFLCTIFSILLLVTSFAIAQDPDANTKIPRKDDPAGRAAWFRKGRQTRNGQPAAKMLHKAYLQKMKLRAARESKIHNLMAARSPLTADVAPTVGTWTNIGPRPIVDSTGAPNGYGPLAGRVTAVAVDQSDATGNTVLVGGAYGGVWRSTNAAATDPTTVQWTPLVDDQATLSVGSIALQPGNSNIILIGTGEPNYAGDSYYGVGILRSTDGGATWSTISQALDGTSFYGTGIAQFAFSTKNPNVVMAATSFADVYPVTTTGSQAGLLISTDAGATWTTVPFLNNGSPLYGGLGVSSVVYNAKEDKFYAVLPYLGVYASPTVGSGSAVTSVTRLTNQPGATGTLSTTACSVTSYPSTTCPLYRGAMTARPVASSSDPDQMWIWYVKSGDGSTGDDQGIWQSTANSSGSITGWTKISDAGITSCGDSYGCGTTQTFYNLYIDAVPNGSNTDLYAGAINIYKCSLTSTNPTCSTTAFKNLTHAYGCNNIAAVHPDQHGIDFLKSNPNIMYFGHDGGVARALTAKTNLNNGACTGSANAFDNLNDHIGPLTQFIWGTNHPTDPATVMGGTQDNGTMAMSPSLPAGGDAGWWEVNGGDGGYDWIDPATPTNWYSAYTGVSIQYCTNTINCNTDTFLPIVEEDLSQGSVHQVDNDNSNFYTPYILDPAKPTQLIVGTCRVWRGGNTAASWPGSSIQNAISHQLGSTSDASCSAGTDPIQSLAAGGPKSATGTSTVIYAGTSGGHLYMSSNANTGIATWTEITGAITPDAWPIAGVAMDPQDATGMTAYAIVQGFTSSGIGHVWQTTNGGTSWTDLTANGTFPNVPTNDVTVDPTTHAVYVATDTGVFTSSAAAGWVWNEIGPAAGSGTPGYLPNVAVLHVGVFQNGSDKRLRAWTHGRGTWETALATGDMTVSTSSLSFTARLNTTSSASSITFTNLTSSAITFGAPSITGAQASEFAVASNNCSTSLAANGNCVISLTFTPTASTSPANANVSIVTSSVTYGTVNVGLTGTVNTNAADFSFDFGTNPTSRTVTAGSTASYTFNLDASPSGSTTFSPSVTLACSGLPSNTTCTFSNPSLSAPGQTVLSLKTGSTTTTGTYTVTVTGTYGSTSHTQNVTLIVQAPPVASDFAFNTGSNPTSTTVKAGQIATYNYNIDGIVSGTKNNASTFSPGVTFACSNLPSKTGCNFSPSSLGAPGAVSLSITTTATTTAGMTKPITPTGPSSGNGMFAMLALPGLGLMLLPTVSTKSRRKRLLLYVGMTLMFVSIMGITSCGGGGSSNKTTTIPGTPAGTYTVTITGTYGSTTHTQNVTLIVQ